MKAIFFAITFLMLYIGLPIPGGGTGTLAALPSYAVTQAAAEETAVCPKGHIDQTKDFTGKYIIVEEPALSTLDQAIQAFGGPPKPEEVVKVVLLVMPNTGKMPMASFDENGCFLYAGSITEETAAAFVEQLKSQKEADAVEE